MWRWKWAHQDQQTWLYFWIKLPGRIFHMLEGYIQHVYKENQLETSCLVGCLWTWLSSVNPKLSHDSSHRPQLFGPLRAVTEQVAAPSLFDCHPSRTSACTFCCCINCDWSSYIWPGWKKFTVVLLKLVPKDPAAVARILWKTNCTKVQSLLSLPPFLS